MLNVLFTGLIKEKVMFLYLTQHYFRPTINLENIICIKQKIYDRLLYQKMYLLVWENKTHYLITRHLAIGLRLCQMCPFENFTSISLRCTLISSLLPSLGCSNDIIAADVLQNYMNFSFLQWLLFSPHITSHNNDLQH